MGLTSEVEGTINGNTKRDLNGKLRNGAEGLVMKCAPLCMGTMVSVLEGLAAGAEDAPSGNSERDFGSDLQSLVDKLENDLHGLTMVSPLVMPFISDVEDPMVDEHTAI
ncbi:hypothetical protein M404DRAFT_754217 [Pisolithus tinctorius Marx 270]|uniref:Uncharacterized protein n=1 Tax=Pisolithus tinctorius Marx 270 TaxID=870435 RepID=A0A0C3P047_PISTI|nr:hypothetical protein M404DRAFT_754217 [Pisolithus tinctorius Marx 270]